MVNYTDNIIPKMTSNSTNGFIATASSEYSSNYQPWGAFDRGDNYWSSSSGSSSGWISCEFPTPRKIIKFTIRNRIDASSPIVFSFDGFDGVNWIVLYKEDRASFWKDGEKREYYVNNTKEYKRYRINISQSQSVGRYPEIAEIEMMEELIYKKTLLQSNKKVYSLEPIDAIYETKMTSNTAPSPFVASASSEYNSTYPAWKAFNGTNTGGSYDYWSSVAGTKAWIQINYGKRVQANILELSASMTTQELANGMPRDFNILASNDNSNFIKLSEFKDQTWKNGETKVFKFRNNIAYQYYRIEAFSTNGYGYVCIGEILFKNIANNIIEVPKASVNNFVNYGTNTSKNLNRIIETKDYILQDEVSKNEQGLWTTKIDRKPLSISFK
ncbi:discoidin domain-containing protein [Lysinibacillus sp. CNPSo 3705]|uniref:discoidin domain-containing protein n=1 Tax=Lysinibacillus sp. CNPSo 3705 TaxID=3028148 RepID=UPI002363AB86|nr:discoidin domain-containing protein [Lysinibacillus sp. CNPSo 3705]MDD1502593.1 discoidin domain-containing protein [Lysinibacillus sp. CNPSo 3705]